MGKIKSLLEQTQPMSPEAISQAFNKRIEYFDFDGITVDDVEINPDGGITVSFVDAEDNQLDVFFDYDEDEGVTATILDGEDDEDFIVIDLDALAPAITTQGYLGTKYPKLDDLSWMNKSALASIFVSGDIGADGDPDLDGHLTQKDIEKRTMPKQFGYFKAVEELDVEDKDEMVVYVDAQKALAGKEITEEDLMYQIDELKKTVIRGGKKVRLAVVRKVRRKKLTPKQKQAIRKAVRKRKAKAVQIKRKRKRSLAIRKRTGLKNQSLGKFRKVAGTANRKR